MQFFDGEKFLSRARHHKRKRIFRHIGGQAAEDFFSALISKEQFPANAAVSIEHWRCRRSDLQTVAVSFDKSAAPHVALDQAFGFELCVGIRNRGAVDAKHGREFTAGRDAVALAQITCMYQGAQLVAKLDV